MLRDLTTGENALLHCHHFATVIVFPWNSFMALVLTLSRPGYRLCRIARGRNRAVGLLLDICAITV